jgi:hypothetical protein
MYTAVFIGKPANYGPRSSGEIVVFGPSFYSLPTTYFSSPGVLLGICAFSLLLCCVIFWCEFYRRSEVRKSNVSRRKFCDLWCTLYVHVNGACTNPQPLAGIIVGGRPV